MDVAAVTIALTHSAPAEAIAAVALACRDGRAAATAALDALAADATRGRGTHPCPCVNEAGDGERAPRGWVYEGATAPPPTARPGPPPVGCACAPGGCGEECPCGRDAAGTNALAPGGVLARTAPGLVFCGAACACATAEAPCSRSWPLPPPTSLVKVAGKGWTLRAAAPARAGAPLASFGGALLPLEEARAACTQEDAAGRACFILTAREWVPSGARCVAHARDARSAGGLARFASHACGAGATAVPVVVRAAGVPWPEVALVAARGLAAGTEISYSYGKGGGGPPCACGGVGCEGSLPREGV
jgi:hypothetical protein